MSQLPRLVQRAPGIFYGIAALYFLASVVLTHLQLQDALAADTTFSAPFAAYARLAIVSAWLQAGVGALHFVAYGVVAHILLAIWRNGRPSDPEVDE